MQKSLSYLNSGSSIILISSVAAKHGVKNFFAYCASKAAVSSMAKSFAAELIEQKIRVNSISPGPIKTSMLDGLGFTEEELKQWAPIKRIAEVEEIASAALYLASDEASFITASDLAIDGGISGISPL